MDTKPRLFLETTIIGYLSSGPSRDVVVAGNQLVTHQWWRERRADFDLHVSELVALELGSGNPDLAKKRLEWLEGLQYLEITPSIVRIARRLVEGGPLPEKASRDAIHIATAAVHEVEFLLTWNCTHIANAFMERRVHAILAEEGLTRPPVICTPRELLSTNVERD